MKSLLRMVSSESFVVWGLTFKSSIHFGFILVHGVGELSGGGLAA